MYQKKNRIWNGNMQISHVLYRVDDLHKAVKSMENAGFIVEYGTKPEKAYNAIIWFEEGIFIELFKNSELASWVKWIMKLFGYQSILKRIKKWEEIETGWCEWSLETKLVNLNDQKKLLRTKKIPFKFHKAKRTNITEKKLKWELLIPHSIDFPFLMSTYTPNPRPPKINHPNGIKGISKLIVGKKNLDVNLLQHLLEESNELELVEGSKGLQGIEFVDSTLNMKSILFNQ